MPVDKPEHCGCQPLKGNNKRVAEPKNTMAVKLWGNTTRLPVNIPKHRGCHFFTENKEVAGS